MTSQTDWNAVGRQWVDRRPQRLWRRLHNELNQSLLARWARPAQSGRILKTDLFDEMVGDGLLSSFDREAVVVGMDYSTTISARARWSRRPLLTCDVRSLPFEDASFDLVVSNSTLDHFDNDAELRGSIGELRRILRPGGRMILTMDNLANPLLALRNRLPFRLLRSLGIVPYPVGASGGPGGLRELVEEADFQVLETRGLSHVPRLPAVIVSNWLGHIAGELPPRWFRRFVLAWERLEALPTRYRTAYYVAMLLEVRGDPSEAVRHGQEPEP